MEHDLPKSPNENVLRRNDTASNWEHNRTLPLLHPAVRCVLIAALNMLHPQSLLRMAWTCSELYHLCLTSGLVKISHKFYNVDFQNESKDEEREKEVNNEAWDMVTHQFERLHVGNLKMLSMTNAENIHCWPRIISFMEKYKVKSLKCDVGYITQGDLRTLINTKLINLWMYCIMPMGFNIQSKIPNHTIFDYDDGDQSIDLEACFENWLENADLNEWSFRDHAPEIPPFYEDMERLPFDFEGTLSEHRPLLFEKRKENNRQLFYLRPDDKLIYIYSADIGRTSIKEIGPEHAPPVFKTLIKTNSLAQASGLMTSKHGN